ncbi:hypothetical protein A2U01_0038075 [Trifolium medium]|uniref:Uncharacterized protein n=1 Tax=Trifolium medium TaxID=97028 RepID=A0A392PZE7_9FABA|nr:hypothetical protein [Trifolium medium]
MPSVVRSRRLVSRHHFKPGWASFPIGCFSTDVASWSPPDFWFLPVTVSGFMVPGSPPICQCRLNFRIDFGLYGLERVLDACCVLS